MAESAERPQVNIRLSEELIGLIDARRIQLQKTSGSIPSRSDIVRLAIEAYVRRREKRR